jgi:hypothetical protein
MKKNEHRFLKTGCKYNLFLLLLLLILVVIPHTSAEESFDKIINFSGFDWAVKQSAQSVGPGPNFFSNDTDSVWIDSQGRLHEAIVKKNGKWYCAEVVCTRNLGYGTYRFIVNNSANTQDQNSVLGLFTWDDNSDYNHREMDIEISRWGEMTNNNSQYVVQPYSSKENIIRFMNSDSTGSSIHEFTWNPKDIHYMSKRSDDTPNSTIYDWNYSGKDIPKPGKENPRINFWLFNGVFPEKEENQEIIIDQFEYYPPSTQ